jgi:hypothetical protein
MIRHYKKIKMTNPPVSPFTKGGFGCKRSTHQQPFDSVQDTNWWATLIMRLLRHFIPRNDIGRISYTPPSAALRTGIEGVQYFERSVREMEIKSQGWGVVIDRQTDDIFCYNTTINML